MSENRFKLRIRDLPTETLYLDNTEVAYFWPDRECWNGRCRHCNWHWRGAPSLKIAVAEMKEHLMEKHAPAEIV